MWSILLLAQSSFAQEKQCPIFTCSFSVSEYCLKVNGINAIYSMCPPTYSCPDFELAFPQNVYCRRGTEDPPVSHVCPKYLDLGEQCTISTYCDPEYYCRFDLTRFKGVCTAKKDIGEYCDQPEECTHGNVCNDRICVPQLSVEVGQKADHALACKSAIKRGEVCGDYSRTVGGSSGKECRQDKDCTASDGTAGECVCAPNQNGRSFCRYHQSDAPIIEALQFQFNGYKAQAKLKMYEAITYPITQFAEECLTGDAKELQEVRMLKAVAEKCAAIGMSVAIFLGLSFLLI